MRSLLYILIFLTGLILFILSIRAKKQGRICALKEKKGKKTDMFEVIAWYFYENICARLLNACKRGSFLELLLQAPQVKQDLRALNPEIRPELSARTYYVRKIKGFLVIFYMGDLLALCVHLSSLGANLLTQEGIIVRNTYGQGKKYINVQLETADGEYRRTRTLAVEERIFTEEELEAFFEKGIENLEEQILGENKELGAVQFNLYLPRVLEGCPFELIWESSDYFLMDHKGTIQKDKIEPGGESLILTCRFCYREWEKDYQFPLLILPPEKTEEEIWEERVENTLAQAEEEQRHEGSYKLPDTIGEKKVIWTEVLTDHSMSLFALVLFAGCAIYVLQDKDLHKKTEERGIQMLSEYPVLINRLTLYLGAGMTIKGAFQKIALDYRSKREETKKKNFAYEEMLYTCYEMQGGVSEGSAYDRFGKRCGLQPYTRLAGLLNQSLKKGNAALLKDLQKEAEDAQEERRNQARKRGEEAGTKLLLPMMMMLGIVMILVMVPAFLSFSM